MRVTPTGIAFFQLLSRSTSYGSFFDGLQPARLSIEVTQLMSPERYSGPDMNSFDHPYCVCFHLASDTLALCSII